MLRGEYSWLMELKNSQIRFEDSKEERLSSTCFGSVKVEFVSSPGRAAMTFTCFNQELFLADTSFVCLVRKFLDASFNLSCTRVLSALYLGVLPCLRYSRFFLLQACFTAGEQILPSRFEVRNILVGQGS